jgi:hypothetical protein
VGPTINNGDFKVFEINDSCSEKNHAPNHHLKGRAKENFLERHYLYLLKL